MKKIFVLILALIICVGTTACGKTSKNVISGEYYSFGFIPETIIDKLNSDKKEKVLKIEEHNSSITYSIFASGKKGKGSLKGENLLLGETEYLIKNNCIILNDSDFRNKISSAEGALTNNKKTLNYFLKIDNWLYDFYSIEFFEDGLCEIQIENSAYTIFYEGKYELEDDIFFMDINSASFKGSDGHSVKKSGSFKTAIYIQDEYIYTGVYKKGV